MRIVVHYSILSKENWIQLNKYFVFAEAAREPTTEGEGIITTFPTELLITQVSDCATNSSSPCYPTSIPAVGIPALKPPLNCSSTSSFCQENLGLSKFPRQKVPDNITAVDLGNNSITVLDSQSLQGLKDLKTLTLDTNKISTIPSDTFKDLNNLTYLDLGHNVLKSIQDGLWSGLKALETLRLTGNPLETIGPQGFSKLPSLVVVVVGIPTLKSQGEALISPSTYPDTPHPPQVVVEDSDILDCDSSNCQLKGLEKIHTIHYVTEDGQPTRPRCRNSTQYWDETDLQCEGK